MDVDIQDMDAAPQVNTFGLFNERREFVFMLFIVIGRWHFRS